MYLNPIQRNEEKPVGKPSNYKDHVYWRQFQGPHTLDEYYFKNFPTFDQLNELKQKEGIEAKRFVLQPGEYLHINAGQLRIFRKRSGYQNIGSKDPFSFVRLQKAKFPGVGKQWNISIEWDFLFIGHRHEDILTLAEKKWINSVGGSKEGFSGLGHIETVMIILLNKYGGLSETEMMACNLKHVLGLLCCLRPLLYTILKLTEFLLINMSGKVISGTASPKQEVLRRQLEHNIMNENCESCGFQLSNSFLTCSSCLEKVDYTISICLRCYLCKSDKQLKESITSEIHRPTLSRKKDIRDTTCNCNNMKNIDSNCSQFFIEEYENKKEQLFKKVGFQDFKPMENRRIIRNCHKCKLMCLTCAAERCECHSTYELFHWWRTESDFQSMVLSLKKMECSDGDVFSPIELNQVNALTNNIQSERIDKKHFGNSNDTSYEDDVIDSIINSYDSEIETHVIEFLDTTLRNESPGDKTSIALGNTQLDSLNQSFQPIHKSKETQEIILDKEDEIQKWLKNQSKASIVIADMDNWNQSFDLARQCSENESKFSADEKKKIKNWLKNQSKTKRDEAMNEKLYSIGEVPYDNDIMIKKWKENSNSKACLRWKMNIHKKRNDLPNELKKMLVEKGVFTWKEINKQVRVRKERKKRKFVV